MKEESFPVDSISLETSSQVESYPENSLVNQNYQESPCMLGSPSNELSIQDHHHTCAHIFRELNIQTQIPKTRRKKENTELEYIFFLELKMYTRIKAKST